jgi:hypothetical protein
MSREAKALVGLCECGHDADEHERTYSTGCKGEVIEGDILRPGQCDCPKFRKEAKG